MTDEEKQSAARAAEAKAAEEATKVEVIKAAEDAMAAKDKEIADLKEERDNYKNVALKRKGKLPADAEFFGEDDKDTGLTVEEQVKMELLERDIKARETEREANTRRLAKENAELKLALKNRPDGAIGSGSGNSSATTVKDNVFSEEQLTDLRRRAERLKADPEAFIEQARKNVLSRG